jgi:uncharacterized protein involved in response to NO
MNPDYLFTAGWRVFFLAAGLWAVISVAIWEGYQILQGWRAAGWLPIRRAAASVARA